jgi:hypothetical protein
MEKEFIPYEQALALKELGFDEPCLMYWNDFGETSINRFQLHNEIDEWCQDYIEAPLYQQAFRWFYWKHHIKAEPLNFIGDKCTYRIHNGDYNTPIFYIPEEAELECLVKLIEIVKEK